MNESQKTVKAKLIKALSQRGSIPRFCGKTGFARNTVESWIDPDLEVSPGLSKLDAIAHALDVEPWELIRPQKPALAPAPIPGLADLEKELRQLAQGKAAKLVESWLNQLRLVKGGLEEDELGDGPIENDPQGG